MAQTQAMQNEERERRTLHDSAQEERIRRLEAMLEQQVLLTTTTTTTMTTNEGPATKPMPEPQQVENIPRPKARLPDLVLFGGNTSN
jgi:hypothetical protein